MFKPSGSKFTYSDLAHKFGWASVILTSVLFPVTVTFRYLFAFPFWLGLLPKNPMILVKTIFQHPSHPDFMRRHLYINREAVTPQMSPFNILLDEEGGYWFEHFWGIIHVLKCDVSKEDQSYKMSPIVQSLLRVDCTIDFIKDKKETILCINICNKWAFLLNPFAWGLFLWASAALQLFNVSYFGGYKKKYGVITIDTVLPNEKSKNT